jgi:hypothetical protein
MSTHVITVRLLTTGWLRWRAECSCGWCSASNSTRAIAERYGAGHMVWKPCVPDGHLPLSSVNTPTT